jgi:catechol 2,3-dioxygenase-like lactoylglutathione lyase family enzyme
MTIRMDHVVVVVDDLDAATAFFEVLGLEVEGRGHIEGDWVDRVNDLDGVDIDIVMLRTPDGHKVELTKFHNPALIGVEPQPQPPNALGLRSIMFEVDDLDDTVARLEGAGGELVGTIEQFEPYRLCYLRGPGGSIVALAEQVG